MIAFAYLEAENVAAQASIATFELLYYLFCFSSPTPNSCHGCMIKFGWLVPTVA
jgi:hypothetical protein